jgi:DNA ligase (NAD+)
MGKILNFCEGMRIKNIGESMIEDLFHAGYIHDIQDLFDIENRKEAIKQLDGFGDSKLDNVIKQLRNLKVPDYKLLGSIGIPNLRAKRAKMILDIYHIHDVLEMSKDPDKYREDLLEIKGIGKKFVDVFLEGIDRNRDLIEFLLKKVKITHEKGSDKVSGYVVFTGFRNPDFEKHLEKGGIIIQSNVTKDTTLVIAKNPDSNSKKIEAAVSRGIDVIGVEDAYVRFGYKY